jgi:hypothetical protein
MPYLNWRDAELKQEVCTAEESGSAREFQLRLTLGADQVRELLPFLEEIYHEEGPELRIDLPAEWILFWKIRQGESRLLMAHPQPEEWVATFAMSGTHGQRVVEALRALEQGQTLSLETLGATGSMTNVEVLITRN